MRKINTGIFMKIVQKPTTSNKIQKSFLPKPRNCYAFISMRGISNEQEIEISLVQGVEVYKLRRFYGQLLTSDRQTGMTVDFLMKVRYESWMIGRLDTPVKGSSTNSCVLTINTRVTWEPRKHNGCVGTLKTQERKPLYKSQDAAWDARGSECRYIKRRRRRVKW